MTAPTVETKKDVAEADVEKAVDEVVAEAAKVVEKKKAAPKDPATKEFSANRAELLGALNDATRATSSNGQLVSLSAVRLSFVNSRCTITGTNLDLAVSTKIAVKGRAGATVHLNARLLMGVVRVAETDDVTIKVTATAVTVDAGALHVKLPLINADGFAVPSAPKGKEHVYGGVLFAQALRRVEKAVYPHTDRPVLNGVFAHDAGGKLTFAATNGKALAVAAIDAKGFGKDVIIPGDAIVEMVRLSSDGDVKVSTDGKTLQFESSTSVLVTRLVEGEFPAYDKLVPKGVQKHQWTVNRESAIGALKQLGMFTVSSDDGVPGPVTLTVKKGKLIARVETELGVAEREIGAKATGGDVTVGFALAWMVDVLRSFDEDEVLIDFETPLKPGVFSGGDRAKQLHLLMPFKLNQ